MKRFKVYDLVLVSLFSAILFVQEQIFSSLPNIQLTFFLIILFSKKLPIIHSILIILIHVILDSLFTSSFTIIYTPFILIGYLIIPLTLKTIFKNIESNIGLAFLSILYAFIYSWLFIIPFVGILKVDFISYLAADLIFEILLAASSFLTTIVLYNPLSKIFDDKLRYLKH